MVNHDALTFRRERVLDEEVDVVHLAADYVAMCGDDDELLDGVRMVRALRVRHVEHFNDVAEKGHLVTPFVVLQLSDVESALRDLRQVLEVWLRAQRCNHQLFAEIFELCHVIFHLLRKMAAKFFQ